jgi:hypothetical protein
MKQIKTIILLSLMLMCGAFLGCTQEDTAEPTPTSPIEEGVPVKVKLNMATSPLQGDMMTRSTSPYTSDVENLIYDIRVLQYNKMGILRVNELCFHVDGGTTQVNSLSANLISGSNNTLVVLVNMEESKFDYPALLTTLKSTKYPFTYDASTKCLPMTGSYTGDITADQTLNITLGRLAVRINLIITNSYGKTLSNVDVKLTHIPTKTYLYIDTKGVEDLTEDDYEESPSELYTEGSVSSWKNSSTTYFYYYMLPNYCSKKDNAPRVNISATVNENYVSYSYKLGESGSSYTLYPNSIYNASLNLCK